MPVFHTKTIESILEPVAQQVSKLIILHEEAEDGNAMPDLARPVQVVKMAVDNLIKVGYETIHNSEDQILKQDMPPALNRVEEASILLIQASDMLRSDPYSAPARKKLIEGSRGILQGTSALLLAFDESEVRKIIRICKNVLEYLAITEVVESMEDLVTFVKNLSPVLTRMTKEVDAREKELTHQVHREWLIRSLEQVKQLTPVLISGIKIYVTTKAQAGPGVQDAQNNRDFVTGKMSNEIHEIIRVLQLTTYDEEEWDADDITVMKKALSAMEGKMKHGNDWLLDPSALPGSSGERALRQILEDALRIADRCVDPRDRDAIIKSVNDITSMVDALAELRAQGKGNSPQALALAKGIQQKLHELSDKCQQAVANTERSGVRKPAHTIAGKMAQAQKWLANPGQDDKGLGAEATRSIINDGRKIAAGLQGHKKAELQHMCDEAEIACNQLSDLCRKGMGDSPQARAVAANLSQKLHHLKNRMQDALVNQVADDFIDITTPLKQMSDAANAPFGTPNRDVNFAERAHNFEVTSNRLADTARQVATAGGCNNKNIVEGIQTRAQTVNDLTPQVSKAARIVLADPSNPASQEHFELLKKQWMDNMERLRGLVDEAVDTNSFIKATEEAILRDTDKTEQAIKANDSAGVVNHTSSIARRANRVLQVAQQEADNSEDPSFVDRVNGAVRDLRATITPMVQNAKGVAQNPRDHLAGGRWRGANQQLIDAVGGVRHAVTGGEPVDDHMGAFPPMPDMNQLHISESDLEEPPRVFAPPPPAPSPGGVPRGGVPPPPPPPPPPHPGLLAGLPAVRPLASIITDSVKPRAPGEQDEAVHPNFRAPRGVYGQLYDTDEKDALFKRKDPNNPLLNKDPAAEPVIKPEKKTTTSVPPIFIKPTPPPAPKSPPKFLSEAKVEVRPDYLIKVPDENAKDAGNAQESDSPKYDIEIKLAQPMPDQHLYMSGDSEADDMGFGAPPPVPPPPMMGYDGYPYGDHAPPRPPLPRDSAPPRPPPPETDDEEDMRVFPSAPQENQPIMQAAQDLYMDVRQWSSRDNEIIAAAKRMALLMAKLSQLVRGEGGNKKDLIDCAKAIAEASEEVTRLAKELAKECTDKRMRMSLLQVCERIPTIGTQLKILSTVKATMLGAQGSEEDQEATEMLVGNAQNLMQSVRETVRAAEAASIKIRVDSGYTIRWSRKRPWYT